MTASSVSGAGRVAGAFAAARADGRCALIPYITAGDPDLDRTRSIVRALGRAGADLVEIGVPFSDPIADGPVNQRAAERALRNGVTLRTCLDLAADLRTQGIPPVVLFTYYNPIHRMDPERFARAAAEAGVDGVLVTDLPPEEAEILRSALRAGGVDSIFLLSPTSSRRRIELVCRSASGFVYLISRTGVTGVREDVPEELGGLVQAVRQATGLPIAVGFGIGHPRQAATIAAYADGIVVGSALVRLIEEHAASPALEGRVEEFCSALRAPLKR